MRGGGWTSSRHTVRLTFFPPSADAVNKEAPEAAAEPEVDPHSAQAYILVRNRLGRGLVDFSPAVDHPRASLQNYDTNKDGELDKAELGP